MDKPMDFSLRLLIGNMAKEVVRILLEDSGLTVYPYGYESFLPRIKHLLGKRHNEESESLKRLRSHPDLMVCDEDLAEVYFIEVKFRSAKNYPRVRFDPKLLEWYKDYWKDCFLLLVVPRKDQFYIRAINQLKPVEHKKHYVMLNLEKDFQPLYDFFQLDPGRIKADYSDMVKKIPTFKNASEV